MEEINAEKPMNNAIQINNSVTGAYNQHLKSRLSRVRDEFEELKRYIQEPVVIVDENERFDVLEWWKRNAHRFQVWQKWQGIISPSQHPEFPLKRFVYSHYSALSPYARETHKVK
jgi:hypothetical protein